MLKRNNTHKKIAVALAVISLFGSNIKYISAYDGVNTTQTIASYADGVYELSTNLKHISKDENSMAHGYLSKSELEIKNGKSYMKLVFSSGNMIKEVTPKVDGNLIEVNNTLDGDQRTITFEVPSIDSDITIGVKINPFGNMVVNADCIVKSEFKTTPPTETPDTEDNPEEEDKQPTETPDTEDKPEEEIKPPVETPEEDMPKEEVKPPISIPDTENKPSNDNTSQSSTYKNGFYELKNIVECDNKTGYAMVRNLLNEATVMEVKDGKTYITFEMSGKSMMGGVKVNLDGKTANYTNTDIGNDSMRIKVEVPSVDSKITMDIFVNAMNKEVSFGIKMDKDTIKFVSSNEEPKIPINPSNSNSNNSNSNASIGNSNNSTTNETVGSNVVKGKLYTIKNEVIHNNPTGKEMARKYLNETSKIEEINGKTYATLTFTGVDLMKDHKIYVNGSIVNHQVVAKDSSSISIKFEIPSVDANIKIALHVIPMNADIDFEVKLLKDTLTFVKEYEEESKTLPQTGSLLNSDTMLMAGSLMIAGVKISPFKKRRK